MLNEMVGTLVFYLLAIISIVTALAVVNTKKILRAAIYLAVVLISSAGFYIILSYEFLAGVQVLIYVGGIVIMLVFAIMLTSRVELTEDEPSPYRKLLAFTAALLFFIITVGAFATTDFQVSPEKTSNLNDVVEIGHRLLDYGADGYVLPFEIISLLLLAAMVGGIVIARKPQNTEEQ